MKKITSYEEPKIIDELLAGLIGKPDDLERPDVVDSSEYEWQYDADEDAVRSSFLRRPVFLTMSSVCLGASAARSQTS